MPPNNNDDNQPAPTRPVMDVQRRSSSSSAPIPNGIAPKSPVQDFVNPVNNGLGSPDVIQPNQPTNNRPATMEYTRPRPFGDESTFSPQQMSNYPQGLPNELGAANQSQPPKPKKSAKGLVIAIFVVLLIAALAGGGTYYYQQVLNKPKAPVQNEPQPQPKPAEDNKIEATPESIDKTIDIIDQQQNSLNDAEDFNPNDVSDQSLGI